MKLIQLSQGYEAIVDEIDYDFLSQWKWHINKSHHLYAMRNSEPDINGKRRHIMMHRVIMSTPDGMEVDHVNGNGLDNRRCNLRNVTRSENMMNRFANKNGTSKFKGVYWHKQSNRWRASITVYKQRLHLGNYRTEASAAKAYEEAATRFFKIYNKENFYGGHDLYDISE